MSPYSNWFYALFGFALVGTGIAVTTNKHKIIDMRGKLPSGSARMSYRNPASVTDISLHHSAGGRLETLESIANYHIQRWGRGMEYGFAIWKGNIYQINDLDRKGYHNGYNNTQALGVVILGNYDVAAPSRSDLEAFKWLVGELKRNTLLPNLYRLVAHNEYPGASTACPGRYMPVEQLRQQTKLEPLGATGNTLLAFSSVSYNPGLADN